MSFDPLAQRQINRSSTPSYTTSIGLANSPELLCNPFHSIDALLLALEAKIRESRDDLESARSTKSELYLSSDAPLALARPTIGPYASGGEQDLPARFRHPLRTDKHVGVENSSVVDPVSAAGAVLGVADKDERNIVQRAASRGIVQAIETVDGFKYIFNNVWSSKDETGLRLSYICQDSTQNKDRHANGAKRTLKHLDSGGVGAKRGPRKSTYNCKGAIVVKFSGARNVVCIQYRHYAIHQTLARRASSWPSPPRRVLHALSGLKIVNRAPSVATGGLLAALVAESSIGYAATVCDDTAGVTASDRSGTRKRRLEQEPDSLPPVEQPRDSYDAPSLYDLLRCSEAANQPLGNSNLSYISQSDTLPLQTNPLNTNTSFRGEPVCDSNMFPQLSKHGPDVALGVSDVLRSKATIGPNDTRTSHGIFMTLKLAKQPVPFVRAYSKQAAQRVSTSTARKINQGRREMDAQTALQTSSPQVYVSPYPPVAESTTSWLP